MKKQGFTIIEMVISLFVIAIILSIGLSISDIGRNIYSSILIDEYLYQIENLLSYGKVICKEKNQNGKFVVDARMNKITFISKSTTSNIEKTLVIPKEMRLQKNITVFVTNSGKIEQGNTIVLIDKYENYNEIKIRVGVDLIVIN